MELVGSTEAADNARRLLECFREADQPVVHVQHIATKSGSTFFRPNTEGVEIHPLVHPVGREEIIVKHRPNSFLGTSLKERLDELNVQQLVIAGMMTHMCLDAGVRAAADLGYGCLVAGDACATRDLVYGNVTVPAAQAQAAFLAALDGAYARVLTTAAILVGDDEAP